MNKNSYKKFQAMILMLAVMISLMLAATITVCAATTEDFETLSTGSTDFTSNGVMFSLAPSAGFSVDYLFSSGHGCGYNSSSYFIDNYNYSISSTPCNSYKITAGSVFRINSLYLYPSDQADGNVNQTASVNVTFTGKLSGTTVFTYTPNTSLFSSASYTDATNRGFTLIDFSVPGYDASAIDELDISINGATVYFAIDNFTWSALTTPAVTTQAVSSIGTATATGNGNIAALGSSNPTAYGVCWNTTGAPTTSDSKADKGGTSATGAFTASMTGLTANTKYYVRAYATNASGTSYGNTAEFTTSVDSGLWDGSVDTSWYTTTASAFTISTAAQLAGLAAIANANTDNFSGDTITLTANIDLNNKPWMPIAFEKSYPHEFAGTFDGNGHTVSNLSFGTSAAPRTTSGGVGLFGFINNAVIKNVGIINTNFFLDRSGDNSGALVAVVTGDSTHISSITNCYAACNISDIGSGGYIGGLIGQLTYGTVTKCYTVGSVKGGDNATVGGLVSGINDSASAVHSAITNCYSTASVSAGAGDIPSAGGLIGWIGEASTEVQNCYATGNIVCGIAAYTGGLIGDGGGTVSGCYYNGTATQVSVGSAQTAKGIGDDTDTSTKKTSAEMKSAGFVADLNTGYSGVWAVDASALNQGYPVLTGVTPVLPSLYKITYDGNGNTSGLAPTDTGAYYSGTGVTLAANTGSLLKSGDTFGGWNTLGTGSGTNYDVCTTYTLTNDKTLYAKWVSSSSAPIVTISSSAAGTTNLNPIPVTITFSSSVTGFDVNEITVANGSKSNFAGSGTTYTVDVTPAANGTVTIGVAAGVAKDGTNQDNLAAANLSLIYDGIKPTVTISSGNGAPTKSSPVPVSVVFSEAVTGFTSADITVTNGTISAFSGTIASYTFSVTPSGQGAVKVNIAAGVATDFAGNGNTAATELSRIYDSEAPTVLITSAAQNTTSVSPIPVTITFSESVTGFSDTYVAVANGTKSNFVAVSGTVYTVDISPTTEGAVTVDVNENVASDAAGNVNTAATQLTRTYLLIKAPTVTTGAVSAIASSAATLNGSVNANNASTVVTFQLGITTSYGNTITAPQSPVTGSSPTAISCAIGGLAPYTMYHYRAVGLNSAGTTYGSDLTFTTLARAAIVSTQAVNSITTVSAIGNGTIGSLGVPNPTSYGVCWNTTGTPTISDSKADKGGASATGAFTASITGLSPDTKYYVRAYATNAAGTSYGDQVDFSTNPLTLLLSSHSESLAKTAGSSKIVNVTSDTTWTAASGSSWLTVSPDSATTGNAALTLTADENPATTARTTYVTVSAIGVTPQSITVTQDGKPQLLITDPILITSRQYDGTFTANVTPGAFTNLAGGKVVNVSATAVYSTKTVGTGKMITVSYTISGANADDYAAPADYTVNTGVITAKDLTIVNAAAQNKGYDRTVDAIVTGAALNGVVGGDTVDLTLGTATFADKAVGNGKTVTVAGSVITGASAGNYTLTEVTGLSANITAKSVIPSPAAANKEYDGTAAGSGTVSLSGPIAGDTVTAGAIFTFADKNIGNAKNVTASAITLYGADKNNYVLSSSSAVITANITEKTISIGAITIAEKKYDGTDAATISAITLTGVIAGDVASADASGASAVFNDESIGNNKTVTVSGSISLIGGDSGNYSLSAVLPAHITGKIIPAGTVLTPSANPAGSAVVSGTAISLSCATAGATIHYTIDGNTPTSGSAIYTTPIVIVQPMTLKAIAVKPFMNDSGIMSEAYTLYTSSSGGHTPPTPPPGNTIIVDNGTNSTGTAETIKSPEGQTVTTVTIDTGKMDAILEQKGKGVTVTIPPTAGSDVTVGVLTGQTVKSMETKEAVLEIKTETASYTLPASEINIDAVSAQIGSAVELKDIKISVSIAEPSADTVRIIEDTANKNSYQLIVKPVEFEITCTSGDKTVSVSHFNAYVERTIEIPSGIDPSRITTGIVLNADGTFSHVPTTIVVINGKYYAKINSLTNSTYSVIYNPVEFTDVAAHWAKAAVNDMGSRMVISGMSKGIYDPDSDITRAQFAAIIVRTLGLQNGTGTSGFKDVQPSDWYSGAVKTATEYGIISGYGNGNFGPNDKITREQAMAMVSRAMKITGLDAGLTNGEAAKLLAAYKDGKTAADYAKTSIAACLKTGIVSGNGNGTIAPKDAITRAEVAVIAEKLLQKSGLI